MANTSATWKNLDCDGRMETKTERILIQGFGKAIGDVMTAQTGGTTTVNILAK
ncbi:MAG: hypothetical protein IPL95_14100 [Saprospiraceae bacterium]|nr:hypothetical protein [Saprospiraceae bacterium]